LGRVSQVRNLRLCRRGVTMRGVLDGVDGSGGGG
jgi:hypothetical protein